MNVSDFPSAFSPDNDEVSCTTDVSIVCVV